MVVTLYKGGLLFLSANTGSDIFIQVAECRFLILFLYLHLSCVT